jgi:hypothetical protein
LIRLQLERWPLVRVRVEPYTIGGGDQSRARTTTAIVDTGAEMTNVTPRLFDEVGSAAATFIRQRGVGGGSGTPPPAGRARVSVVDDEGAVHFWDEITVVAGFSGEEADRIGCLLGMDVLRHADLRIDGPTRSGWLDFPGFVQTSSGISGR